MIQSSAIALTPNDTADTVPAVLATFWRDMNQTNDTTKVTRLGIPLHDGNAGTELIADRKVTAIRADIESARNGAVRGVAIDFELAVGAEVVVKRASGFGSFVRIIVPRRGRSSSTMRGIAR